MLERSPGSEKYAFESNGVAGIFNRDELKSSESTMVVFCRFDDFGLLLRKHLESNDDSLKDELYNNLRDFLVGLNKTSLSMKRTILFLPSYNSQGYVSYTVTTQNKIALKLGKFRNRYMEILNNLNSRILVIDQTLIGLENLEFDSRNWYWNKTPYTLDALEKLSRKTLDIIDNLNSSAKKVIVVDLDNTLWGGVLGEEGVNGVNYGPGNPDGESFMDFQKEILELKQVGYLLAVCSKNNMNVVKECFNSRADFALKLEDFVALRVNWKHKHENIREIASELNLSTDSFVFIDDSPIEREQMATHLPEVLIVPMNVDPLKRPTEIRALTSLHKTSITDEDTLRSNMYSEEKERAAYTSSLKDVSDQDWIKNLKIKLKYSDINVDNIQRVAQLMNKTNQMNMSSRRFTENEIQQRTLSENLRFITISAHDKFGEYGLIGVISLKCIKECVYFEDFLLSCRILGRCVEHTVVRDIIEHMAIGANSIHFNFIENSRNVPMFDFIKILKLTDDQTITITELIKNLGERPDITSEWISS